MEIRHDWKIEDLNAIYDLPLLELISRSHLIHVQHHKPEEVQVCSLISIKTGGCPEDCKYCAQSSRYETPVTATPLMDFHEVMQRAKKAKDLGITRICLGAAWRQVRDSVQFEQILKMVKEITDLGL